MSDSDSGSPIGSLLHDTPKLGIPVESVQFLMKLVETENSCCAPRFPLSVSCYEILGRQTSFTLCYGVGGGNFEKVGVGGGNFGKVGVAVRHFTSDSTTLYTILE